MSPKEASRKMHIKLWNPPYTGGWIWFDQANLKRFSWGRKGRKVWWAILGFSGSLSI
jgi:hypothetical protein